MTGIRTEQPKQSSRVCRRAVIPAPWCRSTVGCLAQTHCEDEMLPYWDPCAALSCSSRGSSSGISRDVISSARISIIHSFTVQNMWLRWGFKALLIYSFSPDLFKLASDSYCYTCTPVLCSEVDSLAVWAGVGRRVQAVPAEPGPF